jgi:hypothetical protein
MRHSQIFGLSIFFGAIIIALLAEGDTLLALFMGGALGCSIAIMIIAFPSDLSYRDPPRRKREVHVVMVDRTKK